jgi:hypothetical protein
MARRRAALTSPGESAWRKSENEDAAAVRQPRMRLSMSLGPGRRRSRRRAMRQSRS